VDRNHFVRTLFQETDSLYTLLQERGFTPVRLAWESLFDLVGAEVEVDTGATPVRGSVQGIAADGALLLNTGAPEPIPVYSGDLRPADV
jgi:BirA family biotin operon repressor/biotin-[acetyl-CoA-carboxylase] ligase